MNDLFTVGHSTRSLEDHLSREPLAAALASAGLAYVHLGDALGGYRNGGYEAYMATSRFQQGLAELENLARDRRVAVL